MRDDCGACRAVRSSAVPGYLRASMTVAIVAFASGESPVSVRAVAVNPPTVPPVVGPPASVTSDVMRPEPGPIDCCRTISPPGAAQLVVTLVLSAQ